MPRTIHHRRKLGLSYNPDDVNIRLQHFRTSELVSMIESKHIYEDTWIDIWSEDDLQRNSGLWNIIQKSLFIESLMIKLPIPLFYFDGGQKPWRVIDGLQRLHTIISFVNSDPKKSFKLKGLEYLGEECDGCYYHELPGYLRARIDDAELEAYVINPGSPVEVKYNIFKRINTGGLSLKGQEIRNAFCRGIPADFTKKLASLESFKKVTNSKVSSRRMDDREYVTRFVAFQLFGYKMYNGKMDKFLTDALLELYEKDKNELNDLENDFGTACSRIYEILGEKSLYRMNKTKSLGRSPNKALFDTLSWNFCNLSQLEFDKLKTKKLKFRNEYNTFMANNELIYKAIADTTGSKTAVRNRFVEMNIFLKDFIQ